MSDKWVETTSVVITKDKGKHFFRTTIPLKKAKLLGLKRTKTGQKIDWFYEEGKIILRARAQAKKGEEISEEVCGGCQYYDLWNICVKRGVNVNKNTKPLKCNYWKKKDPKEKRAQAKGSGKE